jgi:hypothetical protein
MTIQPVTPPHVGEPAVDLEHAGGREVAQPGGVLDGPGPADHGHELAGCAQPCVADRAGGAARKRSAGPSAGSCRTNAEIAAELAARNRVEIAAWAWETGLVR